MEKDKALAAALSQIEKSYGKGSVMILGKRQEMNIEAIPTGSVGLDVALGVGGLPKGRIIEIFGPESSGKTTLTLHVIAEAQKQTRLFASLVSSESPTLDSKWTSMNQVATWVKANRSYELNNQALAQGAISPTSPNSLPKTSKPNYSEDQVRFLVSVSKPYRKVSEIADRLAASQMSCPMLLEHAYLVSDSRFPTQNERDESEKLLKAVEQDRAKTLIMIINARLGSN